MEIGEFIDEVVKAQTNLSKFTNPIVNELKSQWLEFVKVEIDRDDYKQREYPYEDLFLKAEPILTLMQLQDLVNYMYDTISLQYAYRVSRLSGYKHSWETVNLLNTNQQQLNQEADRWRLRWLGYDYEDWFVQYKSRSDLGRDPRG